MRCAGVAALERGVLALAATAADAAGSVPATCGSADGPRGASVVVLEGGPLAPAAAAASAAGAALATQRGAGGPRGAGGIATTDGALATAAAAAVGAAVSASADFGPPAASTVRPCALGRPSPADTTAFLFFRASKEARTRMSCAATARSAFRAATAAVWSAGSGAGSTSGPSPFGALAGGIRSRTSPTAGRVCQQITRPVGWDQLAAAQARRGREHCAARPAKSTCCKASSEQPSRRAGQWG